MVYTRASPHDLEKQLSSGRPIGNSTIKRLSWRGVTVTVPDKKTEKARNLVDNVSGEVEAGELLALMGPSGSGKTTLLNHLARRDNGSTSCGGTVLVDGITLPSSSFQKATSYVEQEDALIGSLTVRETVDFSARLSLGGYCSQSERKRRVDSLLTAFGLTEQAATLVGTPLRKGISGGQKRRTSVAAQIITAPKILFLDEPTSGLDSMASYEIIAHLKKVARALNLLVVISIHQPSTSTYELFDKLLLLSHGKACFFGPLSRAQPYFEALGYPTPSFTNVAEHLLQLTNTDFSSDRNAAKQRLAVIHDHWARQMPLVYEGSSSEIGVDAGAVLADHPRPNRIGITWTLLCRMWLKSHRDVVAYGIRIAMYLGLAIMMGTVWLRLSPDQASIQPFINALFFGSAFMSFMAVAYVPAYIEDHAVFVKDRKNGLYGATPFLLANFVIGVPYLFLISVLFSAIGYWLPNFRPSGQAFLVSIMWLFLDLLAAESLVVLVSSIFPIFVLSLAIVAFANGLWMSVGGFLVTPTVLNVFWKYVFHYIDYQTYVFQGMMVNEFSSRNYNCATVGNGCQCMYQTELASQCLIDGKGVLATFGYPTNDMGLWVGILVGIIAGYRLLGFLALYFFHR